LDAPNESNGKWKGSDFIGNEWEKLFGILSKIFRNEWNLLGNKPGQNIHVGLMNEKVEED
jgi:hypothetical protein